MKIRKNVSIECALFAEYVLFEFDEITPVQ